MEIKAIYDIFSNNSKTMMDLVLIFGPNVAYITQILKFRSTKSSEGFSKKISFYTIMANILRIFFWHGKRFDISLLLQSLVSIIMQLILLQECLRVSKDSNIDNKEFTSNSIKSENNRVHGDNEANLKKNLDNYDTMNQTELECNRNNINEGENEEINLHHEEDEMGLKKSNTLYIKSTKIQGESQNTDWECKENNNVYSKLLKTNNISNNLELEAFQLENTDTKKKTKLSLINDHLKRIYDLQRFWDWPYLIDYITFCIFISLFICIFYSIFGMNNKLVIEMIGYMAILTESMIGIPQVVENYRNKSAENLSILMVSIWLTGDILKILYFFRFQAPFQFFVCGFFQLSIDFCIISQIFYYNKNTQNSAEDCVSEKN